MRPVHVFHVQPVRASLSGLLVLTSWLMLSIAPSSLAAEEAQTSALQKETEEVAETAQENELLAGERTRAQDLERQLAAAKEALDAGTARAEELEQAVADLKQENARLGDELQGALTRIDALTDERDARQAELLAQGQEAERTLNEMRGAVAAAEQRAAGLEQEKSRLTNELQTEREQLATALEDTERQVEALTAERDELEAALADQIADTKKTLESARTAFQASESRSRELEGSMENLKRDLDASKQRSTRLEEAKTALASQLEAEQARLQGELDQSRQESRNLAAEKEGLERSLATSTNRAQELEAQLGELGDVKAGLEAELAQVEQSLATSTNREQELEAQIGELGDVQTGLEAELVQARERIAMMEEITADLQRRVADLRGQLGPEEGGTATLAESKSRAADAVAGFNDLRVRARKHGETPEIQAALEEAREEMRAAQFLVAKLSGAAGVRTVLDGESLGLIAARAYGNSARWPEIHNANRHVLEDPDLIFPGMVVVIP